MTKNKLDKWEKEYQSKKSEYEKFEELLRDLLKSLLNKEGISAQIYSRTKSVPSFKEKIGRKSYSDPFNQMTDIVGIRIITCYLDDINKISHLIRKEFEIDEINSLDKSGTLNTDQFGYKSIHYIISLSSPRGDLPEWIKFKKFRAEIQVRTILQHAWAEIDHKIRYKNEEDIPIKIKRHIYRLMALLELADEEFQNLKYSTDAAKGIYLKDIALGYLKMELNVLSLSAYFSFTKQDERWMYISHRVIQDILDSYETDKNIVVHFEISKTSYNYKNIANLEKLLNKLGIRYLGDFDEILKEAEKFGKYELRKIYKTFLDNYIDFTKDGSYSYWMDPYSNISFLVCCSKADLIKENPSILDKIDYMWVIKKTWDI